MGKNRLPPSGTPEPHIVQSDLQIPVSAIILHIDEPIRRTISERTASARSQLRRDDHHPREVHVCQTVDPDNPSTSRQRCVDESSIANRLRLRSFCDFEDNISF